MKAFTVAVFLFVSAFVGFIAGRETAPQIPAVRYLHVQPLVDDVGLQGYVSAFPCGHGLSTTQDIEFHSPIQSGPMRVSVTDSPRSPQ